MKKFFSLLMVAVMTVAMCSVSFATTVKDITVNTDLYTYDKDSETLTVVNSGSFEAGENLYVKVDVDKSTPVLDDLKNYRLKSSFEYGAKMFNDIKFASLRVNGKRQLVVMLGTFDTFSVKPVDIHGNIKIVGRSGYTINGHDEYQLNISGVMSYGDPVNAGNSLNVTTPIVDFEGCTQTELYFDDGVYFDVDARNQSDLFLRYTAKMPDGLYAKYPDANLDYVGFDGNNKTFYKVGSLHIPYEFKNSIPFIYEYNNGTLTLINGAYNKNDEEFVVKTKTLGNYIISDVALNGTTIPADKDTTTNPSVKPNPPTGAKTDNNALLSASFMTVFTVALMGYVVFRVVRQ